MRRCIFKTQHMLGFLYLGGAEFYSWSFSTNLWFHELVCFNDYIQIQKHRADQVVPGVMR